jgi:hypothetical protein
VTTSMFLKVRSGVRAPPLGSVTTSEPPERVGLYPTTWKASWPCLTRRCDFGELLHHRDSVTRLVDFTGFAS